ncbi:MAG: serine hydrolase [Anaerolineae bacterium]|jgi:CubicO group peptidase (beta-lactamase class C family)
MKSATLLLVLLLTLASCGGEIDTAPRPASTADVTGINLVPYQDRESGLSGVVPEGWFEALPGIFLAGVPANRPDTALIQRLEAGATLDQAAAVWKELLGLAQFPEPAGHRQTEDLTWTLYTFDKEDSNLGTREGSIALAETEAGVVLVVLATSPDGFDALHDRVFVPVVDALAPAADDASGLEHAAGWPVVAAIEQVGNHASEVVEFSLEACTRLRLYAVGEGSAQGMEDFGQVENAASGQIVWQMHFFETEAAGAYKNRRVNRTLTLPAGDYRLRFQTNEAHAFGDWGDQAPGDRFWGMTLYEDRSPDGEPADCWARVESPEFAGWSAVALKRLEPELPGMGAAALMVVTNGQVVFEWGNTANNFQAHSMRKSLMSALYGIYVADGVIDTSKTLEELGIDDIVPLTSTEKRASVDDLLKARSGVYIPAAGEVSSMKSDRPKRGSHSPGSHWCYNNWDFNTLGSIFEQETGQNIYQAFEARIGDPVGMQDFFPERLRYSYEYWLSQHPYYGFRISTRDLARVGQLFLQGGEWQGTNAPNAKQIVPAGWVEDSTQPHSRTGKAGTYSGYGYMWWIANTDYQSIQKGSFAASGYGGHTMEVLPDLNTVIVFRVNTDSADFQPITDPDQLVLRVLEARSR